MKNVISIIIILLLFLFLFSGLTRCHSDLNGCLGICDDDYMTCLRKAKSNCDRELNSCRNSCNSQY